MQHSRSFLDQQHTNLLGLLPLFLRNCSYLRPNSTENSGETTLFHGHGRLPGRESRTTMCTGKVDESPAPPPPVSKPFIDPFCTSKLTTKKHPNHEKPRKRRPPKKKPPKKKPPKKPKPPKDPSEQEDQGGPSRPSR
jgi:hypothetical protein